MDSGAWNSSGNDGGAVRAESPHASFASSFPCHTRTVFKFKKKSVVLVLSAANMNGAVIIAFSLSTYTFPS
jgi:hypothetical protein